MKKVIEAVVPVVVISVITGCSTPYMIDRGHDAADVATISFGCGLGAKAKAGPVQTGLLGEADGFGLRGGYVGKQFNSRETWFLPPTWEFQLAVFGLESYDPESKAHERYKDYMAGTLLGLTWGGTDWEGTGAPHVTDFVKNWTTVECVAACVASIRLGLNLGEMLDFILGLASIDIFDDDLQARKEEQE